MSKPQPIAFVEGDVDAEGSSNAKLKLVLPMQLLYGGSAFDTALDVRALESLFEAKIDWRVAKVDPNFPEAWQGAGTLRTTNGPHPESFTPSASELNGNLWIQGSVWTKLTSGSAPKVASVRAWSTVRGTGWVVARQRIIVSSGDAGAVIPLGTPFGCAGVTGLMFGVVVSGLTGTSPTVTPTACWRSFEIGDPTISSAWTDLESVGTFSSDDRKNGTSQAITTTGKQMAQPGIKYTVGGTFGGAVMDVIVAAKK